MAASQNGWRANDISVTANLNIPGTTRNIRVRKDAPGQLLVEVASAFDRLVEDIEAGQLDDWGYAERPIRGATALSNHASGTAIDLNALKHPLGRVGTFSPQQKVKIQEIIATTGNVIRWGGSYSGRKDEMHFEINDGRTMAQCETALAAMRRYNNNTAGAAPPSSGKAPISTNLKRGSTGESVKKLQGFLNRYYPHLKLVVDGVFGTATENGVKEFQRRYGHGLAVDGIVGPATRKAMGL